MLTTTNSAICKIIILNVTLWTCFGILFISNSVAQQLPLDPITSEESDIVIDKIENIKTNTPIFNFHSKTFEICLKNDMCGPGNYKDYIPIRSLIVFKGCKKSRAMKKSIIWELKFIEFAPSVIEYGQVPYNAKQIVKATILKPEETYTVCVYPKNNNANCSKWVFTTDNNLVDD